MTGLEFHVEGPVGQFALGRGKKPEVPPEHEAACPTKVNHRTCQAFARKVAWQRYFAA